MASNEHVDLRMKEKNLLEVNAILKTYIKNFVIMATTTILNDRA